MSAGCLLWIWLYAFTPGPSSGDAPETVYIPADTGFTGIEKILVDKGVISPDIRFNILARLMGASHRLQAGEYYFQPRIVPYQLLLELEDGSNVHHAITIPEGSNLNQIADILAAGDWVNHDEFIRLAGDRDFINSLGVKAPSLEGYLFPDTYNFVRGGQSAESILRFMHSQMQQVLVELKVASAGNGYAVHEILTLASIVEKETALPSERPLIAKVFLNRLKKGMRLQTDPTVIYGIENFDGNLTLNDLRTHTPYNTYVIHGLPPGPIGNPGREAIQSVLNPARESYLYFVSKNDGSHYFSRNLAEHNRAVHKYQKSLLSNR